MPGLIICLPGTISEVHIASTTTLARRSAYRIFAYTTDVILKPIARASSCIGITQSGLQNNCIDPFPLLGAAFSLQSMDYEYVFPKIQAKIIR